MIKCTMESAEARIQDTSLWGGFGECLQGARLQLTDLHTFMRKIPARPFSLNFHLSFVLIKCVGNVPRCHKPRLALTWLPGHHFTAIRALPAQSPEARTLSQATTQTQSSREHGDH